MSGELTIYHVRGTRSVRPIWLCYELDLAVHIEPIDYSPKYRNTPEWRAISPSGKVPALTDGELTMFESGAMVDYLLEKYGAGRLQPSSGTPEWAIHRQWCWFSEATLSRPVGLLRLLKAGPDFDVPADAADKTYNCLLAVEGAVSSSDFLLGADFTAADIMMGYTLHLLANVGQLDERFPHTGAYLDRLKSRDTFDRALKI